jgi:hypothetical protein
MSINNGLKAYVRYDGTGRIVPGGPIFSHTKPKNGDWVEIDSVDCCTTTTTSTTTVAPTTTTSTTTVPLFYTYLAQFDVNSAYNACNNPSDTFNVYSADAVLTNGSILFYNNDLNGPVITGYYAIDSVVYHVTSGYIDSAFTCTTSNRRNWVAFGNTIFRTGFETDRASWWSGNTVTNVTSTNPDYIFTAISGSELTGGLGYIQSRTLQADGLATPSTITPTYTFTDNVDGTPITHSLQDYYNYLVKVINNSFLASRNPTIVIKRASLPQVGIPIDGWFIVTVDFDATGNELWGYAETYRSYDLQNLPSTVVVPWAYNSIGNIISYSGGPIAMELSPDSTTWINGMSVLSSGWTIEEDFPIPGTW